MRKNIVLISYLSLAVALSAIETVILPTSIIPGVKLGFANLVVLVTLYQYGIKEACFISFMRVIIVSLILGTFLTPTFFISIFGMSFSLLSLIIIFKIGKFSVVGVSVVASVFHIIGQLIGVALLMNLSSIINIASFLIYIAILTGTVIGYVARKILNAVSTKWEVKYGF